MYAVQVLFMQKKKHNFNSNQETRTDLALSLKFYIHYIKNVPLQADRIFFVIHVVAGSWKRTRGVYPRYNLCKRKSSILRTTKRERSFINSCQSFLHRTVRRKNFQFYSYFANFVFHLYDPYLFSIAISQIWEKILLIKYLWKTEFLSTVKLIAIKLEIFYEGFSQKKSKMFFYESNKNFHLLSLFFIYIFQKKISLIVNLKKICTLIYIFSKREALPSAKSLGLFPLDPDENFVSCTPNQDSALGP